MSGEAPAAGPELALLCLGLRQEQDAVCVGVEHPGLLARERRVLRRSRTQDAEAGFACKTGRHDILYCVWQGAGSCSVTGLPPHH